MAASRRVLFVVSGLVLLASAAMPGRTEQPPDRTVAPKPGPPPALRPPVVQKRTLSNGLPVWIVEQHKVPVAHVSIVVKSGGGADPRGKFGVANLTAEMLDEGAGRPSALEIADAVEFLGASLGAASSFDFSTLDLHVPSVRLPDALPILADVLMRPAFSDQELTRVRQELLTSLVEAEDDPESLIRFAFPRLVFGSEHRYGTAAMGTAAAIGSLTSADLRAFHAGAYVPANALAIVTGDVDEAAVLRLLESSLGSWQKATAGTPPALPAARQLTARQLYLIDKPGAAQSQIRIGWVGVPRATPDYFALRVLNTILGGAFTSRLNTNLREEHGYAYGATSSFDMRASAGPFFAAAGVETDKTAEALTEFFKELAAIRQPVPAGELDKAKNYLALQLPRNFETSAGVAATLAPLFVYNLPDDYFATYTARVRAVTQGDVRRAAERYIDPAKLAVVVVGDRKTIEPRIKALNLGPMTIVTAAEVMK